MIYLNGRYLLQILLRGLSYQRYIPTGYLYINLYIKT